MRVVLVDDDATAQLGASRQYRKPLGDLAGRTALTRELLCCLSTRASRGCPHGKFGDHQPQCGQHVVALFLVFGRPTPTPTQPDDKCHDDRRRPCACEPAHRQRHDRRAEQNEHGRGHTDSLCTNASGHRLHATLDPTRRPPRHSDRECREHETHRRSSTSASNSARCSVNPLLRNQIGRIVTQPSVLRETRPTSTTPRAPPAVRLTPTTTRTAYL